MYLTAVDLGSSHIKGVVAEVKKGGSLVVTKTFKKKSRGIKRGEIIHPDETVKALFESLSDVKRFDRRALRNLVFGISGTKSRFHVSRAAVSIPRPDHEILPEDVERVIKESLAVSLPAGWEVVHSFPREFIIDDIEVDNANVVGLSGRKLGANVILISLFSSVYKNFLKVARLVLGKKSEFDGSLFFSPLACERAVLTKNQKELGVVLVDIGFGTTSVVAFQEEKMLAMRVFPVGAGNITNDLAVGLKCSIETAESVKRKYGSASARSVSVKDKIDISQIEEGQGTAVSRKFVAEIIEARVREIFGLIHQELVSIEKGGQFPAGVVLTGGGAQLAGVLDVAREELRLPVHIGIARSHEFEVSHSHIEEELSDPEMTVACGLVLSKIDMLGKGSEFGLSSRGAYNLNESRFKKFIKTLLALD